LRCPLRLFAVSLLALALPLTASAAQAKCCKQGYGPKAGAAAIKQLRPGVGADARLLRKAAQRLERSSKRLPRRRETDLAVALSVPPNAETAPLLAELGIPAVAGIPPIAVLSPVGERRFDSRFIILATGIR
jgi:hypothetical protein